MHANEQLVISIKTIKQDTVDNPRQKHIEIKKNILLIFNFSPKQPAKQFLNIFVKTKWLPIGREIMTDGYLLQQYCLVRTENI